MSMSQQYTAIPGAVITPVVIGKHEMCVVDYDTGTVHLRFVGADYLLAHLEDRSCLFSMTESGLGSDVICEALGRWLAAGRRVICFGPPSENPHQPRRMVEFSGSTHVSVTESVLVLPGLRDNSHEQTQFEVQHCVFLASMK